MWRFVEIFGDCTSFFVRPHRGFVVPKPSFEFSGSEFNVLEAACLAMDLIDDRAPVAQLVEHRAVMPFCGGATANSHYHYHYH